MLRQHNPSQNSAHNFFVLGCQKKNKKCSAYSATYSSLNEIVFHYSALCLYLILIQTQSFPFTNTLTMFSF